MPFRFASHALASLRTHASLPGAITADFHASPDVTDAASTSVSLSSFTGRHAPVFQADDPTGSSGISLAGFDPNQVATPVPSFERVVPAGASLDYGSHASSHGDVDGSALGSLPDPHAIALPGIVGTAAGNWLVGTEHDDNIYGLDGNDLIFGGAGNDLIVGGRGKDYMDGNAGADTFRIGLGDSGITSDTADVIAHFKQDDGYVGFLGDHIEVNDYVMSHQTLTAVGRFDSIEDAAAAAQAANDAIGGAAGSALYKSLTTTYLLMDLDGDHKFETGVQLTGTFGLDVKLLADNSALLFTTPHYTPLGQSAAAGSGFAADPHGDDLSEAASQHDLRPLLDIAQHWPV